MRVLLVEDDPAMQTALARALGRRGMAVETCGDGRTALGLWRETLPDAVLLDLTLPGLDGLQLLEQARQAGLGAPVLILTARGTVGDRVLGLNAGADDYLPKPFDLDEVEARLRALLRRSRAADAGPNDGVAPVRLGRLAWERDSGAVLCDGHVLDLTPRESRLLHTLLERPTHAVAKERLFEAVFPGEADIRYEAIEVVVYRLRKKLAGTGVTLMTLRGLGYLVKAEATAA